MTISTTKQPPHQKLVRCPTAGCEVVIPLSYRVVTSYSRHQTLRSSVSANRRRFARALHRAAGMVIGGH